MNKQKDPSYNIKPRHNPHRDLVPSHGLGITLAFDEFIRVTLPDGRELDIHLLTVGYNQAMLKTIADRSVQIERVKYIKGH